MKACDNVRTYRAGWHLLKLVHTRMGLELVPEKESGSKGVLVLVYLCLCLSVRACVFVCCVRMTALGDVSPLALCQLVGSKCP